MIFLQHFVRGTLVKSLRPGVLKFHTVTEHSLQSKLQFDRLKCRNNRGLNLDTFEIVWDIYTAFCPRHFCMRPLSLDSEEYKVYNVYVLQQGRSLVEKKLSK